jgi:hypothetical protein
MLNIKGLWTGTLVYGKEYGGYAGHELHFDMELDQENERIWGKALDTGGKGMNTDPATIEGQLGSAKINFVKQYESLHYALLGKTIINKSRKGPLIHYTGTYDAASDMFSGKWKIETNMKLFWLIPYSTIATGTWKMWPKASR